MKTPITLYGGKGQLLSVIHPLVPEHLTYNEPFIGGGALFWSKEPSAVEVINDVNCELINFYEMVQNEFIELEKYIRKSLHSRSIYNDALIIYSNPHLFNKVQRAWAVWVLASQSFAYKLGSGWGYEKRVKKITGVIANKRNSFTFDYALRLEKVQIECTDALKVIRSRDNPQAFHYCDPPYFNASCGHYKGYTIYEFEELLKTLELIEGKFLLSSYSSELLTCYTKRNGWYNKMIDFPLAVCSGVGAKGKRKMEILTANYPLTD
ncbi:DNA adenine methylase [Chryseobacterium populi]|uniref:site-specific DNA-methyltransferase (adenine-specific) n=1 Tax=Chryseobacterium populi TaxID=1144316 RepID=J2KMM1_9FLAO|nr:DNA adenine methylase [Chryseobacterium populi]EJL74343.1 site-specific DNA methylase [Chryseobacterium populi]